MSYYVRLIGHTAFVDNISRTLAVKDTARFGMEVN